MNTSAGVFGPYFTAYWMHEFENDNPSIISKYVNDPFNTFFVIPTAESDPRLCRADDRQHRDVPEQPLRIPAVQRRGGAAKRDQLWCRSRRAQAVLTLHPLARQ